MSNEPLIAVINDDPAFLEFIASFLESETSYESVVWDDGVDSIDRLRQHRPDVVILDVKLGDQAVGQEILATMRNDNDLRWTPVIVCTADSVFLQEHADLLEALNADVLEKPFDLEVLERKVKDALSSDFKDAESSAPDPVG